MIYKSILRPLLFSFSSEAIHDLTLSLAQSVQRFGVEQLLAPIFKFESPYLSKNIAGIKFANPVGLAAGFDKNCKIPKLLGALGFGHIEIGSVTAQAQPGNPKPRIFRLTNDSALINRMGFPSEGAEVVSNRLKLLRSSTTALPPIGVNLGKTKVVSIDAAAEDYLLAFKYFAEVADYFVVNVSSPNTPDLRKLQEPKRLTELFDVLQSSNYLTKPVFVKIAPDLSLPELDQILDICEQSKIAGIIATNTTFDRNNLQSNIDEIGGLSGAPLFHKAHSVVEYISKTTNKKLPIIAAGGISSGEQALQMLQAGASLIQIYTGLVYQGPGLVKKINQYLHDFCKNNALKHLNELK